MIMVCCWLMAAMTFAETVPFGKGKLTVTYVASNAVRIQYSEGEIKNELPDWAYVSHDNLKKADVKVVVDKKQQKVSVKNAKGRTVFTATRHQLENGRATMALRLAKG